MVFSIFNYVKDKTRGKLWQQFLIGMKLLKQ